MKAEAADQKQIPVTKHILKIGETNKIFTWNCNE